MVAKFKIVLKISSSELYTPQEQKAKGDFYIFLNLYSTERR